LSRFSVVGLNHRTASLDLRGAFSFEGEALGHALGFLREKGVPECLVLSTCNRTEVYAFVENDTPLLELFHRRQRGLGSGFYRQLYRKQDAEAVRHLFNVASGLDSRIVGENEIQGQLRRAFTTAQEEGLVGARLRAVVDHAIRTGKRVRSETEVGRQVLSMGSLAVRKTLAGQEDFSRRTVAVVGTGDIARRILKELVAYSPKRLLVVSRSESRASLLAREFKGEARSMDGLDQVVGESDVVFAATHSETPLIRAESLAGRTVPLALVDLAVPAIAEREIERLSHVFLANVDDLAATLADNQKAREKAAESAVALVEEEVQAHLSLLKETEVSPLLSALHRKGQEVGREQLRWALDKMGDLSEGQEQILEVLTHRLVNRLLHHPLTEIKALADDRAGLEVARRLLGLGESSQEAGRVA